jgi:hypothetical protein
MVETYSHARIEAKADAVRLLSGFGTRRPTRHDPEPKLPPTPVFQKPEASQPAAPQFSVDLMNPAIQAEIALQVARQVAVALQREREQQANGACVITLPHRSA